MSDIGSIDAQRPCNAPIGIFDSGVGGLSVARHIADEMPCERLLYFADSAHAPYGSKSL
ncbi:MAG: glutamate racemase, partial [Methylococcus sp.]